MWLSYLFVLFYLAIAAGAVTHEDLFFERSVKLPFLNIELPLLAFFFLAPILFVIVHAYTLVHLVMLTEKAKRYHRALFDPEGQVTDAARENLQWQLPSNIFIQFITGPSSLRGGPFGWLLRAIGWATLVIAPVLLLLMMQIQFLPFHSSFTTWAHRVTLIVDLALIWWLWRKISTGHEVESRRRLWARVWAHFGPALNALQRRLPSNIFVQLLAAPADVRGDPFYGALLMIAWTTLAATLIPLLLLVQVLFLPFPSGFLIWTFSIAPLVEWVLLWRLWRMILSLRTSQRGRQISRLGLALSAAVIVFSCAVATFPGESQEELLALPFIPTLGQDGNYTGVSIRDWIFGSRIDEATCHRRFPFSNTLVLTGLDVYEGLGVDDPNKAKWRDFVFRARGRDLTGAIFDFASLPKVDFEGAQLQGASFKSAQLQGASLDGARLQTASLDEAQLQGAWLVGAQLQDASLEEAQLQGASLRSAQLQGAKLDDAQLQYAQLDYAHLQGASFEGANLHGTELEYAELDGAKLTSQLLQSVELYDVVIYGVLPSEITEARRYPSETRAQNDADYAKVLAAELKTLVCSGGKKTAYILRGLLRDKRKLLPSPHAIDSRLADTGAEAPALVDFIMGNDCPVAAPLSDADQANLLQIKQDAEKEAGTHGAIARSTRRDAAIKSSRGASPMIPWIASSPRVEPAGSSQ